MVALGAVLSATMVKVVVSKISSVSCGLAMLKRLGDAESQLGAVMKQLSTKLAFCVILNGFKWSSCL